MNWILENKEWLFSGIGVSIIVLVISLIRKNQKKKSIKMEQESGDNSTNIQIGGDFNG
jgi:predicted tellurium resistance membrane protein TerC